jgi:hypothetical protein
MSRDFDPERPLGRYFCRNDRAHGDRGPTIPASERYSWGIYAGMYCDACWAQDGRNRGDTFDPDAAGEHLDED